MSKAVLLSMHPERCRTVANSSNIIIDIRKTKPKLKPPFKCYIYCTNSQPYVVIGEVFRGDWETELTTLYGYNRKDAERLWDVFNGKIIGEFTCDKVEKFRVFDNGTVQYWNFLNLEKSGFTYEEIADYIGVNKKGYAWHISDLKIYDMPKYLHNLFKDCGECTYENCKECQGYYAGGLYEAPYCMFEHIKPITCAPRSWCYIEEDWW